MPCKANHRKSRFKIPSGTYRKKKYDYETNKKTEVGEREEQNEQTNSVV
jgi:hypothetical protein